MKPFMLFLVTLLLVACGKTGAENFTAAKAFMDKGDMESARPFCEKGAEQGNADAQNCLGLMYLDGKAVAQDDKQAFDWFSKAAAQGQAESQFKLGILYHKGKGVTQDYAMAKSWFEKAAAQNYAKAQYNLGIMYHNGAGMPKDDVVARSWFEKAVANGSKDAETALQSLAVTPSAMQPMFLSKKPVVYPKDGPPPVTPPQ